ncbi:MAG: hypothetical protein KBA46_00060 [Candidatus Omnitrophica bacterium]|nr:hypothetical protein [Candidatus Omnitrophota bacterium]
MKKHSKVVLGGLLFLACFYTCWADVVRLKSGREINGYLKKVDEKNVVVGIGGGSITFARDDVESVDGLTLDEARVRTSTVHAFIKGDKDQAINATAQEGFNAIVKTRKREFKSKPTVEKVSQEQIQQNMNMTIQKEYGAQQLTADAKLLKRLGLLESEQDFGKDVLETMSKNIAGYYDTKTKKIYVSEKVLSEFLPGLPSLTVMHEEIHALQDQYFDLEKLEELFRTQDGDHTLAQRSIVEGEATVLMYDAFFRAADPTNKSPRKVELRSFILDSMLSYSKHSKTKESKPAIFLEVMLFPYVWGGQFIQHAVNTGGWEAVDRIYQDMPTSTEQIMHPEKYYLARDNPHKVTLPDCAVVAGTAWKEINRETLGEFTFYLVGKHFIDELSAKVMSEGWAGDECVLLENQQTQALLLVSSSRWDSQRDAEEFKDAYQKIIEKKYKQLKRDESRQDEHLALYQTEEGSLLLLRAGQMVLLIEGAPESLVSPLRTAILQGA